MVHVIVLSYQIFRVVCAGVRRQHAPTSVPVRPIGLTWESGKCECGAKSGGGHAFPGEYLENGASRLRRPSPVSVSQNYRSMEGRTPLIAACADGNKKMVIFLITMGAEIDSELNRNMSPLSVAVDCGHMEVTRVLLRNGADPHRKLQVSRWIHTGSGRSIVS